MPEKGLKRRSSEADDKASKKIKSNASAKAPSGTDEDGLPYWEISSKRRVAISQFKKVSLINIREYYESDGKMLPGKKGISLSIEQYLALVKALPSINAALRDLGEEFDEPETGEVPDTSGSKMKKKEKAKSRKSNIEATSDEEEDEDEDED